METNTIYQFHGCFYHRCKKCFDGKDYNSVVNEKYYNLLSNTRQFTQKLCDNGYEVVKMWECQYNVKKVDLAKKKRIAF